MSKVTIVNVGYRSTNFWVVSAGTSLLLDDGSAFIGDLTHPAFIGHEDPAVVNASWQLLRERGATHIYPGHGPIRPLVL